MGSTSDREVRGRRDPRRWMRPAVRYPGAAVGETIRYASGMGRRQRRIEDWRDADLDEEDRIQDLYLKKLRGKKRYFRKALRRAESDIEIGGISDSPDGWSNLWHAHVDWRGYGNRDSRLRRAHLRILLSMMDGLIARAAPC